MSRTWEEAISDDPSLEDDLECLFEMNGRELMEFIMKVDSDTGIAIMVEEGAIEPMDEGQMEGYYDDKLREIYGNYELVNCSFTPSMILKKMAPDAYQSGFTSYMEDFVDLEEEFPGCQMEGMYMEVEPFFGGKKMDGPNDTATIELRDDILARRPDLLSEREAMALKANTQHAAGAWSPDPKEADAQFDRRFAEAQAQSQGVEPQRQQATARMRL